MVKATLDDVMDCVFARYAGAQSNTALCEAAKVSSRLAITLRERALPWSAPERNPSAQMGSGV
jgi:hypothetical protein